MKFLLTNLVFTLIWGAISASFTPANLLLGFAAGALSLWLIRRELRPVAYPVRPLRLLLLALLFFKELAISATKVALLVLRSNMALKPGIFAYPLALRTDFEITLLANLITLTPGTLSVDVSEDRKTLYVHALDCADPGALRRDIAGGFERRIREAFER
ncbi:MAG: Na+/H+ antiporter subunit E [Sinorhizobium meliloti]|jgi:multicomponent Na+:H+ antiporter subunit E|uniref:Na+/H+ antiporter subunit E n=1 Tax=Sinorhizobium TaxID=28105 RepID=UPI00035F26D6|nr:MULTISPECIES: Na+/H+ antiporter subunit E [Sinorhizobium]MCG5482971.1 Na+/H+ antiporter subunit E [Sinorhizobium meliloti]PND21016.1 Na+/H+ antiporter subunit E [Ensifer sp. MMN_5]PND28077.1 Na+/H+ antiporter subunit E [Sinorhizobium sp. M4_45]RVP96505.1 Na+/H+ antiporter subunit E [Sinorhizobium meliloti]